MSELKPCPFCGNTVGYGLGIRTGTENVYCQCGCLKPAQGWNGRAGEDALNKRITALEAENASLKSTIIEADAQFNEGKTPATIQVAELALVRMCSVGREALDKVGGLEAENASLKKKLLWEPPEDEIVNINGVRYWRKPEG